MKMKIFLAGLFLLTTTTVRAEEFPGGNTNIEDEFTKGFSESTGMQESDRREVEADRLKIGGSLQAEYQAYLLENPQRDVILSPMTLEMYLDSQLKNDIRAFFKGRLIHDASIDESVASPLTGNFEKQSTGVLDEMKLSFHTKRKVFWTLGKQKIKWGASKFWNPTDFLNLETRDFLRQEDLRSGVSMIKAHVPWKSMNFYAIAVNEAAIEAKQTGAAARAEIPFATAEWTVSSYARQGQPTRIGSDLSFALWDFDVYVEGAQTDRGNSQQVSGGVTYEFKYSDEDTASVGLEGFWQEDGATTTADYSSLVTAGTWNPFHIASSYVALNVILLKPGSFNDSNYVLYAVRNNVDESQYYRLAWSYTGITDIYWMLALGGRLGDAGSEMKYFDQTWDALAQVRVQF